MAEGSEGPSDASASAGVASGEKASPLPKGSAPKKRDPEVGRPSPASDESEASDEQKKVSYDLLRQLRAEVQDLQGLLLRVRDGQATLATYHPYVARKKTEVAALFNSVFHQSAVANGDQLRHITNQWEMLLCSPILSDPEKPLGADEQVKELAFCDQRFQEMVTEIGNVTIPARLNEWLKLGWNGYLLPFHDLFADEMPRAEDRQRLLRVLAAAPDIVKGGIVEPASGLIFPYHQKAMTRLGVCAGLLLGYLLSALAIFMLGSRPEMAAWTAGPGWLLIDWLLVVVGVTCHYAVNRSKSGAAGGAAAIPLGHPTLVIDARAGVITLKGMVMLIGFFGLLFLTEREKQNHLNFFLVGYSLDSFVGLVSSSLDQRAATRGTELGQRST